jgi:hypothetical protein
MSVKRQILRKTPQTAKTKTRATRKLLVGANKALTPPDRADVAAPDAQPDEPEPTEHQEEPTFLGRAMANVWHFFRASHVEKEKEEPEPEPKTSQPTINIEEELAVASLLTEADLPALGTILDEASSETSQEDTQEGANESTKADLPTNDWEKAESFQIAALANRQARHIAQNRALSPTIGPIGRFTAAWS